MTAQLNEGALTEVLPQWVIDDLHEWWTQQKEGSWTVNYKPGFTPKVKQEAWNTGPKVDTHNR